jgi:hypothetical protein
MRAMGRARMANFPGYLRLLSLKVQMVIYLVHPVLHYIYSICSSENTIMNWFLNTGVNVEYCLNHE